MTRSYEFTKEQVLEATKGSMGIISQIARNLGGCDWHTAQKYVNRWAETRQAYADECERQLDLSESKMLQAIGAGDGPMIRFHLSTKGRNRGYVIRQETEVTGKDGGPVEFTLAELVAKVAKSDSNESGTDNGDATEGQS